MSSPLKTFVLRLPSRPAGLSARCCPRASLTTTARPVASLTQSRTQSPLHPQRSYILFTASSSPIQQQLRRKGTSHAAAAQKELDAGRFRTAGDLNAKHPSSQTPRHEQVSSDPARTAPPLDWNTFFKLRLKRRRIQVFFSATMGIVGFVAGVALLPTGIAEPLVSQIPLDPFISLGLLTIAFAGAGWLVGPSIGSQVFYLTNGRFVNQIKKKEAEFFARIKKNRVDPANSSAANPGKLLARFSVMIWFYGES